MKKFVKNIIAGVLFVALGAVDMLLSGGLVLVMIYVIYKIACSAAAS